MRQRNTLKNEWYAGRGARRHSVVVYLTAVILIGGLATMLAALQGRALRRAEPPPVETAPPMPAVVESTPSVPSPMQPAPPPGQITAPRRQSGIEIRSPLASAPIAPPMADEPSTTGATRAAPMAPALGAHRPVASGSAPELAKADDLLKGGNVAGARLWLSRAAERGDPEALLRLGETFDPAVLTRWGVVGLAGDSAKAREYYARAAEAGHVVARERLAAQQ